jgi:2-polyprenyl-6-methoxyphenol hydroxylase-like FAD-dependent oxidoreductase
VTGHGVVIAGGGPTGMMLAAELTLAGIDVVVVERRTSQDLDGSRAGGLQARTLEVLDQRGIAERFLSAGQAMQVNAYAQIPLDISDFPSRHNYGLALWQSQFEHILAGRLDELRVPILRGREVMGLAQDDSGVDVQLSDDTTLRTEYVAGCDGGRSLVRKAAGIEFPGFDASTSWMIAEVEMDEEPEFGFRRDSAGQHAIGRRQEGEPIRVVLTERTVEHVGEPNGRVLLAGDAAHVHPPQGGQGLNIGVQDAVNLGWKLAQVVDGTSDQSLLDTYHAERHPIGARVLRHTMAQVALGSPDDRHQALRDDLAELLSMDEPRRRFAGMLSGLDVHYDIGEGHPLLGRRMPDLDLATADGPVRVFTLLHDARGALLNLGGTGALDTSPWADRVRAVDADYDGEWELPVLGHVAAPAAVLVRPDGYVAWVGNGTDTGLRDALTTWFGSR